MDSPVIISVGSGKGGVGKSSLCANLATLVAQRGHRVVCIDADLGGANLHLCLGVRRPAQGLQDFISGRVRSLADVAIDTAVDNVRLISGASDILELANPRYAQKQKIISQLRRIETDFIIVDLGAGTDANVVDFYAAFPDGILVSDSLPTSLENAYGFMKNSLIRGIMRLFPARKDIRGFLERFSDPRTEGGFVTLTDMLNAMRVVHPDEVRRISEWMVSRRNFFVLNMVRNQEDVVIGKRFAEIVKKYLTLKLYYVGYVVASGQVPQSIREMKPAVLLEQSDQIAGCLSAIADNILALIQG